MIHCIWLWCVINSNTLIYKTLFWHIRAFELFAPGKAVLRLSNRVKASAGHWQLDSAHVEIFLVDRGQADIVLISVIMVHRPVNH